MDNMHKDMSLMIKRGNKLIELKGMEKAPTASALIFYNLNTAEVFMSDVNLPVPPAGKQFQLWAYVFGSPVDLGVMNLADSTNDVHAMKNVSNADWFAVTLEPQGGSTVPNAAEMLLSSK